MRVLSRGITVSELMDESNAITVVDANDPPRIASGQQRSISEAAAVADAGANGAAAASGGGGQAAAAAGLGGDSRACDRARRTRGC